MKKLKRQNIYLLFALILGAFITLQGCSGGDGGGGEWDTPTGPTAALAPTVTATAPLAGALAVPVNIKSITAAFSTAMEPTTLTTDTFTLACNGNPVPGGGDVTYLAAGNVATLPLPAATNLPMGAACTATVTTGARDTAGTALAQNYVWNFTTGTAEDTTKPTVTLTNPETTDPGPTPGVPANTAITATFSEDMDPATITAAGTFTVENSGGNPVVGMAIPVTYNVASRTATFRPLVALDTGETYTATILAAATDVAGNALAGDPSLPLVANDYSWQFTTVAPVVAQEVTVDSVVPLDGAIKVCPSATIEVTFIVAAGLKMDADTLTTETFLVKQGLNAVEASSVKLDTALTGTVATFTPLNLLVEGMTYTVTIKGGALGVKDLASPTANEMTNDYTWDFTVGPATGVCLPPVNLGLAATFGTFGGTAGMTNAGNQTVITGSGGNTADIGTTSTANATITGFHEKTGLLVLDDHYSDTLGTNSGQVTGSIFTCTTSTTGENSAAVNAAECELATQARLDAEQAYLALAALPSDGVLAGNLAGLTIYPGVWTNSSTVLISGGNLTLDGQGNQNAVFVFQIGTALTVGDAADPRSITLTNGAQAKNIFWQVGTAATINPSGGGTMEGTIIANSGVSFSTVGAADVVTLNGRAQSLISSVTMVNTVINVPAP